MRIPKEASLIINTNTTPISVKVTLSTKLEDLPVVHFISLDLDANYKDNFTDTLSVMVHVTQYDLIHKLLPNRNNLNVTINITRGDYKHSKRFIAFIDDVDTILNNPKMTLVPDEQHLANLSKLQFQLLDYSIMGLRGSITNGIFRKATTQEVVLTIMQEDAVDTSTRLNVSNMNIVMANPDNNRKYEHIHLPNDTNVLKAVHYIQQQYGIYNGGVNTYKPAFDIDNNLYIYPPYKTITQESAKLMIHVNTDTNVIDAPVSHKVVGSTISIVVHPNTKVDFDIASHYQKPIIKESVIPSALLHRTHVGTYRMRLQPANNTAHEIMESPAQPLTPYTQTEYTENLYQERSNTLQHNLYPIQFEWSNSNFNLLKPAMITEIYEANNILVGILLATRTVIFNNVEKTYLTIGIDKNKDANTNTIFRSTI